MNAFTSPLIVWYKENKRELPWRETKDPYKVWVSEIILQQTKVNQGVRYYFDFIKAFPSVVELANAEEDEVLKIWQGLGYYSRARNMHRAAKMICEEYKGIFPRLYKNLLRLNGIGPYTAAAISSICFNENQTVVDGNVYRLLSRVFGIDTPINSTKGNKEFYELAHSLNCIKEKGMFNQALMEFGAIHCTHKLPKCESCIFDFCYAKMNNVVDKLPVKISKSVVKKRNLNFLCLLQKDKSILLERRNNKDIWQGLYQFPLIETTEEISTPDLLEHDTFKSISEGACFELLGEKRIVHQLSHQKLYINIITIRFNTNLMGKWIKVSPNDINDFAFPVPLFDFIKEKQEMGDWDKE